MSSSDVAVSVRGLSKSYTIAHNAQNHTTAAEAVMHRLKNPLAKPETETFWALKDVEFDIQKGDVVGIIGRNGAGKSTLLKVLSRITEPTTGQIDLYGRVGSLLEVGTGFHPELTGRENVYLNGAILGMKKSEIARQFDAIVDFSGTEQFLDTPVKRYSSGMYVRLAFAVAAHLNPEILIVDEVLAVGDTEFQQKCLGKMQDVAQSGRTVIFVSHNMAAMRQLCSTCIYLQRGQVLAQGPTDEIVSQYLYTQTNSDFKPVRGKHGLELTDVNISSATTGRIPDSLVFNEDYILNMTVKAHENKVNAALVVRVSDEMGTLVSSLCSAEEGQPFFDLIGTSTFAFPLPRLQLFPGRYSVDVLVATTTEAFVTAEQAITFEVLPSNINGAAWAYQRVHGLVRISDGCQYQSDALSDAVAGSITDYAKGAVILS